MSIVLITVYLYNYFTKFWYFRVLEASTHRFIAKTHKDNFFNCRIKLRMKRPVDQLTFDELWIEDRLYKVKITNEENQPVENGFNEKQVLYINVDSEINYHVEHTLPSENLKSKIFLGYKVGGKRKFLPINHSLEELSLRSVA